MYVCVVFGNWLVVRSRAQIRPKFYRISFFLFSNFHIVWVLAWFNSEQSTLPLIQSVTIRSLYVFYFHAFHLPRSILDRVLPKCISKYRTQDHKFCENAYNDNNKCFNCFRKKCAFFNTVMSDISIYDWLYYSLLTNIIKKHRKNEKKSTSQNSHFAWDEELIFIKFLDLKHKVDVEYVLVLYIRNTMRLLEKILSTFWWEMKLIQ